MPFPLRLSWADRYNHSRKWASLRRDAHGRRRVRIGGLVVVAGRWEPALPAHEPDTNTQPPQVAAPIAPPRRPARFRQITPAPAADEDDGSAASAPAPPP
jgi:hypothetical protein